MFTINTNLISIPEPMWRRKIDSHRLFSSLIHTHTRARKLADGVEMMVGMGELRSPFFVRQEGFHGWEGSLKSLQEKEMAQSCEALNPVWADDPELGLSVAGCGLQ